MPQAKIFFASKETRFLQISSILSDIVTVTESFLKFGYQLLPRFFGGGLFVEVIADRSHKIVLTL